MDQDTVQHTLEICPAWADQRRVLVNKIGADLSLQANEKNGRGEKAWEAMEKVISQKETAVRGREDDPEGGGS